MIKAILAVLLAGVLQAANTPPKPRLDLVIQPDEELQARLDEAIKLLSTTPRPDEAVLNVERLGSLATSLRERFVQQALLYADDPRNGERRFLSLLLVERFETGPTTKVLAVIPFLEDERTRQHPEVQRLLRGIEGIRFDARPDFSHYQSLLQGMKGEFPEALANHMFRRSPGAALLTYMRNDLREPEELRKVLWAEHIVDDYAWRLQNGFLEKGAEDDDVTTQLQSLAQRDEWWARRYVVEILRLYPYLDDGKMLEELRSDANDLVKKAVSEPKSK